MNSLNIILSKSFADLTRRKAHNGVCARVVGRVAVERFNANRAALVQSRIKALERMADIELVGMGR